MQYWSKKRLDAAEAVLARSSSTAEAARALSRKFKKEITPAALKDAVRRNGRGSVADLIGEKPAGPSVVKAGKAHEPWRWTRARVDEAIEVLSGCSTTREAAAILSNRWSRRISSSALAGAMREYDNGVSEYLKKEEFKPRPVTTREPDPETGLLEQYQESMTVQSLKAENRELLKQLMLSESRNHILSAAGVPLDIKPIVRREKKSGLREGAAVALASDWHIEEFVDPRTVADSNKFNPDIARLRVQRFFKGLRWLLKLCRHNYIIRHLVLALLGDFISGHIHEDLAESNAYSPIEAMLLARSLIASGVKYLLEDEKLERIDIPCNFGNHGRTTKKKRVQTAAKNSFEWLMYKLLEEDFKDEPRVQFIVAYGAHIYHTVYDRRLHFHHGDDVAYNGGIGGLTIPLRKAVLNWQTVEYADYHHVAHHHHTLDLGSIVANGSLIGYTPFSMKIKAAYRPAEQYFYVLDSKRGKSIRTELWVDERYERTLNPIKRQLAGV